MRLTASVVIVLLLSRGETFAQVSKSSTASVVAVARDDPESLKTLRKYGIHLGVDREGLVDSVLASAAPKDPAKWMPALKGLPHLRSIFFSRDIDDSHLAFVRDLSGLTSLDLACCSHITDKGVANLRGLARLERLRLTADKKVTDAGIAQLKGLTKLLELDLRQTGVTDAGLRDLGGLLALSDLDVSGTKVSDKGLEHLSRNRDIISLALIGTAVTDSGLAHLPGLKRLFVLSCERTKVTVAGVQRFVNDPAPRPCIVYVDGQGRAPVVVHGFDVKGGVKRPATNTENQEQQRSGKGTEK